MIYKNLGTVIQEYPPNLNQGNPRNSEGAFLSLKEGRILFVYSRFKGESCADAAAADIYMAVSEDDGNHFEQERQILTCEEEKAVNIMSLSLLRMENGDIGLFYLVRTTYTQLQMFLRRSADEGKTWGPRILCTNQDGFFVVNNDRVTRLSNGRILIPAAVHRTGWKDAADSGENYFDSSSDVVFFYSDDDGFQWTCSSGRVSGPYGKPICQSGLQEPGVLELEHGILWGWARTDLGRQFEMFSMDCGDTWTSARPSRFTSPNSPLSMKRCGANTVYAVWNPVPEYNGRDTNNKVFTGGRTPYVISVSRDNGRAFSEPVAFEEGPDSGYCYCAMHFTENALLLAYCAGSTEDGGCLNRLRIRRIPLTQFMEMQ